MDEQKIQKKIKQLKKIPTFYNKTDEEIRESAIKALEKKEFKDSIGDTKEFDFSSIFSEPNDLKYANDLLKKYLVDFNISTQSDRSTLMQLIQLEVWQGKLSAKMQLSLTTSGGKFPAQTLNIIHSNLEQIRKLKLDLGLSGKQDGTVANYIQTLVKRGKLWAEKLNKADRTFVCQHCGKLNLLLFKVDMYDPVKHPFFQGRYITNPKIMQLYIDGKITQGDVGEIFDVAKIDYIEWMIKKFYNKEYLEKIKQTRTEHYGTKYPNEEQQEK